MAALVFNELMNSDLTNFAGKYLSRFLGQKNMWFHSSQWLYSLLV